MDFERLTDCSCASNPPLAWSLVNVLAIVYAHRILGLSVCRHIVGIVSWTRGPVGVGAGHERRSFQTRIRELGDFTNERQADPKPIG
jgi:hypothetical protein